jgi:hypothetical protein
LEAYAARGIRHITSFAAWVDADYAKRFGNPLLSASTEPGWAGRRTSDGKN